MCMSSRYVVVWCRVRICIKLCRSMGHCLKPCGIVLVVRISVVGLCVSSVFVLVWSRRENIFEKHVGLCKNLSVVVKVDNRIVQSFLIYNICVTCNEK